MSCGQIERNDPCPCGSGRKFKKCNVQKCASPSMRKFKASILTSSTSDNFFQRSTKTPSSQSGLTTKDLASRIRSDMQS